MLSFTMLKENGLTMGKFDFLILLAYALFKLPIITRVVLLVINQSIVF